MVTRIRATARELKVVAVFTKTSDEEMECAVCFEAFSKPIATTCSHVFCEDCLRVWTKIRKSCPMCEAFVIPGQINPIFTAMVEEVSKAPADVEVDQLKLRGMFAVFDFCGYRWSWS